MTNEEQIVQELVKEFPFIEGKSRIQRARRIWIEVPLDHFMEVFTYAVKQMDFVVFGTITGLDAGDDLAFIYHLAKENGIMVNIQTAAPKTNPVLPTITGFFPAATLAERELVDLLGAKVEGLPEGKRYPLPDDWPAGQYPLRKDWKTSMLDQKTTPATPSEKEVQ